MQVFFAFDKVIHKIKILKSKYSSFKNNPSIHVQVIYSSLHVIPNTNDKNKVAEITLLFLCCSLKLFFGFKTQTFLLLK